ncbi:MAG: helix-turn-helix transcriptional regulator [Spirochaetaceae bacterium]|jgi:DNA-binding CsgD family transcriptional regulator|nr:helix-turn-helix transcriptional regulator [Spirochaetaceae bacterium]
MKPVLLITYILLFSLGCVGSASIGFLHKSLKTSLTRYLFYLFLTLLVSVGRILLDYFLSVLGFNLNIPMFIQIIVGIGIGTLVYYLIYKVLVELKNITPIKAFAPTAFIFILQIVRTIIYYVIGETLTMLLYPFMISLISFYLFFVGLSFKRGIDTNWNQALQILINKMGNITMVFAPLSAIVYISLHFMGRRGMNIISLDFLFLAMWSIVSVSVVLHYLTRLGTIPGKTTADQYFLDNFNISPRETEVLELILKGYSNKEIGDKLFISFTTARTHVSHIFEKTNVNSRMELVSKIMSF